MKDIFTQIYKDNSWKDAQSVSGQGSNMKQTAAIRRALPKLFEQLHVKSLLDIPCGDFNWFSHINLSTDFRYIGADIVNELIYRNQMRWPQLEWLVLDATISKLPEVDMIFCRDMLGHLDNAGVKAALKNFKRSGATYLLATTYPGRENVVEIETGQWRPINLASLFGLPSPVAVINEECTEGKMQYTDKSLGLWRLT